MDLSANSTFFSPTLPSDDDDVDDDDFVDDVETPLMARSRFCSRFSRRILDASSLLAILLFVRRPVSFGNADGMFRSSARVGSGREA